MSLDISLINTNKLTCDCGKVYDLGTTEVFDANITHNLNKMADAAGIYEALWRPASIGKYQAFEIIPILEHGLQILKADPKKYSQFNPSNGWGTYDGFIPWIEEYLEACKKWPESRIWVSR